MSTIDETPIAISEVYRAKNFLTQYLRPTGLIRYPALSDLIGTEVFVKHENHNPTGTFKIRGGLNLIQSLKKANVDGVITFSTGNHGLSIAAASQWLGSKATVVVPWNNNPVKNNAIQSYGAELIEAGKNFDEASARVQELCHERDLYYAHPCNEPHIINGVATGFLEVVEELPDVDVMIVP